MATQGIVAKATSRGNLLFQSFPSHHSKAASVLATAMAAFDAVGFFEQLGDQQLSEQLLKEEREEEMKQNALEHHRWQDELAKGLTSLQVTERTSTSALLVKLVPDSILGSRGCFAWSDMRAIVK